MPQSEVTNPPLTHGAHLEAAQAFDIAQQHTSDVKQHTTLGWKGSSEADGHLLSSAEYFFWFCSSEGNYI